MKFISCGAFYKCRKNGCTYRVNDFVNYKLSKDSEIEPLVILTYVKDAKGFHDHNSADDAILVKDMLSKLSNGEFIRVDEHGNEIKEDYSVEHLDADKPDYTTSIWY